MSGLRSHLDGAHGVDADHTLDGMDLDKLHDERHRQGDTHEEHLLRLPAYDEVHLADHLAYTHHDPPDGSWDVDDMEDGHLHGHQHDTGYRHTHEGMVLHPHPIGLLRDHCHFTHLDRDVEITPDENLVNHHDLLHAQNKIGVPHEHLRIGTHLLDQPIDFGQFIQRPHAVVGDPIPQPVTVKDHNQQLPPEINPENRRMVLIAAGEFEALIEVRRRMMANAEAAQKAQEEARRLWDLNDQHFRVLERLGIHPQHYEHLLPPGEVEWAHGIDLGSEVSLYEAVGRAVEHANRGRVTVGTNQPPAQADHQHSWYSPEVTDEAVLDTDPEEFRSPGSKGA